MSKEWDKENMKTIGVNLKKEDAEKFKIYAEKNGTTAGALLRGFIQSAIAEPKQDGKAEDVGGVEHIVSYRNTDRLKHEVAFHNPKDLNPDEMLNDILDQYFAFVKRVRQ